MKKIFNLLIIGAFFYAGLYVGAIFANIEQQRKELEKDPTGKYHNACKSRIVGKLNGKPCVFCSKKWASEHPMKSEIENLLEYCEKRNGKKAKDFTDEEMAEFLRM